MESLKFLLEKNNFSPLFAKKIQTHGGSIRVYAGKNNLHPINSNVGEILKDEAEFVSIERLRKFKDEVLQSKLDLLSLISDIKRNGESIFGISAPSRASTLINYVGLDQDILDCIVEIKG